MSETTLFATINRSETTLWVLATFGDFTDGDRVGNSRIACDFSPVPPSLPACNRKFQPLEVKIE